MNKIINTLLFLSIIFLANFRINNDSIKEIKIASINWSIVKKSPIPVKAFWVKGKPEIEAYKRNILNNKKLFSTINNKLIELRRLKPIERTIDTRISCLLIRYNGITDTLSFGRTNLMKYNNNIYELDKEILSLIIPYLPKYQKMIIKDEFELK